MNDHRYVERIVKHQARQSLLLRTNRRTSFLRQTNHQDLEGIPKPLRAHKPYTYTKSSLHAKDVFVRTSRLERKSLICMHKPLKPQKSYNLRKAAYIAKKPYNLRKAACITQKLYNLRIQTDTAVLNKSTRKKKEEKKTN